MQNCTKYVITEESDGAYNVVVILAILVTNIIQCLVFAAIIKNANLMVAYAMQNSDPSHDFIKNVLIIAARVVEARKEPSDDKPSTPIEASSA